MGSGEIERRFVHASGAVIPIAYVAGVIPWDVVVALCVLGTGVAVTLEIFRLRVGLDWVVFDKLTREYEHSSVAGYALYVVGATFTVLVFEPLIAVPALFMLTIVDPISGYFGKNKLGERKRASVLFLTFVLCFGFAYPFVSIPAAVLGAVVVTVADGMTPVIGGRVIDDNLSIPIGGATAMWLGQIVMPW